jgi:hypothetical protein
MPGIYYFWLKSRDQLQHGQFSLKLKLPPLRWRSTTALYSCELRYQVYYYNTAVTLTMLFLLS